MEKSLPVSDKAKNWIETYKIPLMLSISGVFFALLGLRLMFYQDQSPQMEFVKAENDQTITKQLVVDVSGAIEKPGVYSLDFDSRIKDALVMAGGLSADADRKWISKHTNLAAKLIDGTKIYIPRQDEVEADAAQYTGVQALGAASKSNGLININTASTTQLDTLPGVGPVTAGKIIAARPFNSINELLSKKAVNSSTFEKIKDKVTVY